MVRLRIRPAIPDDPNTPAIRIRTRNAVAPITLEQVSIPSIPTASPITQQQWPNGSAIFAAKNSKSVDATTDKWVTPYEQMARFSGRIIRINKTYQVWRYAKGRYVMIGARNDYISAITLIS